jgi:hypothetical protein
VRNKLRLSNRGLSSSESKNPGDASDKDNHEEPRKLSSSAMLTLKLGEQMGKELGMQKGEMAMITQSESTIREAKSKGVFLDESKTKGILKKSDSTSSKSKSQGESIDKDETAVQGAYDLPLTPPPLKKQGTRAREISFGTEFKVDYHTDSSPSKLKNGSARKGISFSDSTVSTKDVQEGDGGDEGDEGDEKMADELAGNLAIMVGGELGEERGGETKSLTGSTRSVVAAKSWRERAKRSFGLSPKSKGGAKSSHLVDGEEEEKESPKKVRKSWGGLRNAMKSSLKMKRSKQSGADETTLEDDHDAKEEEEPEEPEPEPLDPLELATGPLCPSVIEICGIPIKMMLDGGMEVLDLEKCRLGLPESYLLSHGLKACPKLTNINLSHNKFKPESVRQMKDVLMTMKDLKALDFSHNLIFKSGGVCLCDVMKACENLECLKLNNCELTNAKDEPMIIRKGKESPEDIIPDMFAALKMRNVMANHKKVIVLELEENGVEEIIIKGIFMR